MVSAQPVNAILVGYGYWGSRFFGIARRVDKLRIVSVVDVRSDDDGFIRPASTPCGSDLTAALADPRVEAVIIATPAAEHVQLARQSLRAGKHVFIEKPFTLSTEDTVELLRLAQDSGLMLTVDHQYWWSPEIASLSRALADVEIGTVVAVSVERAGNGPARHDVGALWDLAVHDVSVLVRLGVLQGNAKHFLRVDECQEVRDGPVAGCVTLTGRTPMEVTVRIHACWMSETRRRRLVISGESGSLHLAETDQDLSAWLVKEGQHKLLSRTEKSDRGTPIELALDEFSDGAHGRPDLSKAVDAGLVVTALEQMVSSAQPITTTVRSARCWL